MADNQPSEEAMRTAQTVFASGFVSEREMAEIIDREAVAPLKARIAELESELKWWKSEVRTPQAIEDALNWIAAEGQKHDDAFDYSRFMELIGEFKVHHRAAESECMTLRAANAELVAALRDIEEIRREGLTGDQYNHLVAIGNAIAYALARAESGEPHIGFDPANGPDTTRIAEFAVSEHPDTERITRLCESLIGACESAESAGLGTLSITFVLAEVSAARKEVSP